jgi:hypothetical protein
MFALGVGLCCFAFLGSYLLAKRSLAIGMLFVLLWGYFYGILRANILTPASHFLFDSALAGLYASRLFDKPPPGFKYRTGALGDWISVIAAWTLLIALMPFQTPLVTLVGLRGNFFFIPVLLLAARLRDSEFRLILCGLAVFNMCAFAFGTAEYFLGLQRFYPLSPVTELIYRSRDAGGGNYRIPAIFSNAHSYAGTMVGTLPLLLSLTGLPSASTWQRLLAILGSASAFFGVLYANTRTNFALAGMIVIAFVLMGKMKIHFKALLLLIVIGVCAVALTNERFQRFRSLQSTEEVAGRIAGSVNRSFLEVLTEYPMGNGLGGGGTSIPHFLASQVRRAIGVENEYARIALELGIPGLIIWVGFLGWTLARGANIDKGDPWRSGRILQLFSFAITYVQSMLGTGLLTSIPGTVMSMIFLAWLIAKPDLEDTAATAFRGAPVSNGHN